MISKYLLNKETRSFVCVNAQQCLKFRRGNLLTLTIPLACKKTIYGYDFLPLAAKPSMSTKVEIRNYKSIDCFDLKRICETEIQKSVWKTELTQKAKEISNLIENWLKPYFVVTYVVFDDSDFLKVRLETKAVSKGLCNLIEWFEMVVLVKEDNAVCNEVVKKSLFAGRKDKLEMKIGDRLTIYVSCEG